VRAAAYGAASRRGSLRGRVVPFAMGTLRLYRAGEAVKITEFEVDRYFTAIRESLEAYYHASLWAEIVRKTHGGGAADGDLFDHVIDGFALVDECASDRRPAPWSNDAFPLVRLTLQWIWRYAQMLGVQPEIPAGPPRGVAFRPGDHGFEATGGPGGAPARFAVGERTIAYLIHTSALSFRDAVAVPLTRETARNALSLALLLAEDVAHDRLNTVSTGAAVFTV